MTNDMPVRIPRRRRAFLAATLLVPLLCFALLEAGLRLVDYDENLDLFVPAPAQIGAGAYLMINLNVGHRYFPAYAFTHLPPQSLMLKDKPVDGYRVFALGESTTAGWPYANNLMFPHMLAARLAQAFPERHVAVVSVAMVAIGSYGARTVRNFKSPESGDTPRSASVLGFPPRTPEATGQM